MRHGREARERKRRERRGKEMRRREREKETRGRDRGERYERSPRPDSLAPPHTFNLSITIMPQIHFFSKKLNLPQNRIPHHMLVPPTPISSGKGELYGYIPMNPNSGWFFGPTSPPFSLKSDALFAFSIKIEIKNTFVWVLVGIGIRISKTLRKRYFEKVSIFQKVWWKVFGVVESESIYGFSKFWKKFLGPKNLKEELLVETIGSS